MTQDAKTIVPQKEQDKISKITLEKSLEAYRVLAAPSHMSWKKHYTTEEFSSPDLLRCDQWEQKQYAKRLRECTATIYPRVQMTGDEARPETIMTLENLVQKLTDPSRANLNKMNREIIYSTHTGKRPVSNDAFMIWNGFQVIDIDLKLKNANGQSELIPNAHGVAEILKAQIFNSLHKCNWFLGVTFSSSGNGLHIYTKIAVPDDFYESPLKMRMLFLTNFRHKYSFVYIACLNVLEQLGYTKNELQEWMDLAMFKPQQGAFIGYDPHPYINTGFFEDFIYICFDNVEDMGHPEIDWVTYPDLKEIFARFEWFIENADDKPTVTLLSEHGEGAPTSWSGDKVHYKHNERWRLANTLVNLYGLNMAIKLIRQIVSNKVSDKELIADCKTAAAHAKPLDIWAVNRLNTNHGFKIKIKVEGAQVGEEELYNAMEKVANPNSIMESQYKYNFYITKDQYLGDILPQIMERVGRISLIEAGPGLGKTEMVKQLVKSGKKVMMILPFTSVIKSKVETEEGWYYSYGSRKPRLDVENGLALTVDKFSRLNMMDIKAAGFDYIFLDESHLLFMSEYRPVMSKVIDMIRNTEVPIILMSGTPTGETVFFPDIIHLHVTKEETRQKAVQITLVDSTSTLMFAMCRAMANDIANGKRILFPTNEGTQFSKRVEAGINYFLLNEHQILEPINMKYYKKSNVGDDFMDGVNFEKSIKDVQCVLCTTYMGCGVDIEDRFDFQIYFGDLCTAAECDQWCNRLRNNNLFVKMYIAKNDADGNSREIHKFRPMNFKYSDEELRQVHSILRICNSMIERNPVEYKYNSVVSSIIRNNRYIVYDEINCKYHIDEIAFKTVMFERKYRDYAEQLPVFMKGMECYGYEVTAKDVGQFQVEGSMVFQDLKNLVKLASDEQTALNTVHIEELLDLMDDTRLEMYKDVMAGTWEIRKGQDWKEDAQNRVMIVKNVEVFEKVVPIFISMTKRFEIKEIRGIFEYCRQTRRGYNFSAINRIRTLVNIVESDENKRLDLPIKEFVTASWEFADRIKSTKDERDQFIVGWANQYMEQASDLVVQVLKSEGAVKMIKNQFEKLFKCLVKCTRPDKHGNIEMERQELLWPKKEFMMDDKTGKVVLPDDFMDVYVKVADATIKAQADSVLEDVDLTPLDDVPF